MRLSVVGSHVTSQGVDLPGESAIFLGCHAGKDRLDQDLCSRLQPTLQAPAFRGQRDSEDAAIIVVGYALNQAAALHGVQPNGDGASKLFELARDLAGAEAVLTPEAAKNAPVKGSQVVRNKHCLKVARHPLDKEV
jgi:hypothetical protein